MSVANKRVVACTPYGRELTVSVLLPYMIREHELGVLDEWQLWMNTDPHQHEDVAYADKLAREHSFIVQKYRPAHRVHHDKKQYMTRTFLNTNILDRYRAAANNL